jgi:hypothetical protein
MRFEIIASFEELNQDIFYIDLPDGNYTKDDEEQFMRIILNCMDEESVKKLVKLSVIQFAKSDSEAIQWLIDRNGKYFFNYGVNNDPDTKSLSEFKIFYLNQRKRLREQENKKREEENSTPKDN